jgi:hypothetical protein
MTKEIQPGIRLREPLYERLLALAQRERRSLNAQVNLMLEKAADEAEDNGGTASE